MSRGALSATIPETFREISPLPRSRIHGLYHSKSFGVRDIELLSLSSFHYDVLCVDRQRPYKICVLWAQLLMVWTGNSIIKGYNICHFLSPWKPDLGMPSLFGSVLSIFLITITPSNGSLLRSSITTEKHTDSLIDAGPLLLDPSPPNRNLQPHFRYGHSA